jgi:hypothetical protein
MIPQGSTAPRGRPAGPSALSEPGGGNSHGSTSWRSLSCASIFDALVVQQAGVGRQAGPVRDGARSDEITAAAHSGSARAQSPPEHRPGRSRVGRCRSADYRDLAAPPGTGWRRYPEAPGCREGCVRAAYRARAFVQHLDDDDRAAERTGYAEVQDIGVAAADREPAPTKSRIPSTQPPTN